MPQDPCKCDPEVVEIARLARCRENEIIVGNFESLSQSQPPGDAARQILSSELPFLNALDEFLARCG